MLDARAAQYACTPAELVGLDLRAGDPVEAWSALAVNEVCYLAGGRREAMEADRARHDKVPVFPTRELRLRR